MARRIGILRFLLSSGPYEFKLGVKNIYWSTLVVVEMVRMPGPSDSIMDVQTGRVCESLPTRRPRQDSEITLLPGTLRLSRAG
jgi:hypothetical protein